MPRVNVTGLHLGTAEYGDALSARVKKACELLIFV